MVNFCVQRALETKVTSFAGLRNSIYAEFKARWPSYATHYCHSAVRVATSMLKSWRNRCRKGMSDPNKPPKAMKLFMRLDDHIAKFRGDRVIVTTASGKHVELKLVIGDYQRKFVEAWKLGSLGLER